ncbi:MAG: hypothetical protein M3312_01830 [Actinomycetota bacterium]|nr:hypothetical protein [Actinomycetota bacterium]
MPLLDWLRGRDARRQTKGSEAERAEVRREQADMTPVEQPETVDAAAEERRQEEASRHSGI